MSRRSRMFAAANPPRPAAMRTGRCVAVSASGAAEPVPDDGVVGHWGAAPPPRHVTVTSDTLDAFAVPRATLDRVLRPPGHAVCCCKAGTHVPPECCLLI